MPGGESTGEEQALAAPFALLAAGRWWVICKVAAIRSRSSRRCITPAQLPAAGQDATLATGQPLTVVGYGTSATQGSGPPTYPPTGQREAADLALQTVTTSWVHESQNPTLGYGGACGGDSGGPNYIAGTHTIIATTITGDMVCRATNVSIRLDTPAARSFLATQVSYPLP